MRAADFARIRSIWPRGRVTQISPIHSTREVDRARRFATLDRLQVALAGLQPHHGFLAEEARKRVPLFPVNHDHVAVFVFGQHGIAGHLESDGFPRDRKGEFDLAEALRRHLLVFRLDDGARTDAAHDRHRIEPEIFHDRPDFGGLYQPEARQDLGNRPGAHAHGNGKTALALARSLQRPFDRGSVQHGHPFFPKSRHPSLLPNFGKNSNYEYQKYDLT